MRIPGLNIVSLLTHIPLAVENAAHGSMIDVASCVRTITAIIGIRNPFQISSVLRGPQIPLTGPVGAKANFGKRRYLYFGGTNYLGLAGNPLVRLAASAASAGYGAGFCASRSTTGTSALHLETERMISKFMGTEDACLCTSGGHANEALFSVLLKSGDVVICEKKVHSSIAQSAGGHRVRHFDEGNLDDLSKILRQTRSAIIAISGVDSMSGKIAPLDRILGVLPDGDFRVLVDDCHGVGVLGQNGRGTIEHYGIHSPQVYQTATLSKAFGCFGGFIAGSRALCDAVRMTDVYRESAALPPAATAAGLAAVIIAMRNPRLRTRVIENTLYAATGLRAAGIDVEYVGTPILMVKNPSGDGVLTLSMQLQGQGVYVPALAYGSAGDIRHLRIAVSASHTKADIDRLCRITRQISRKETASKIE